MSRSGYEVSTSSVWLSPSAVLSFVAGAASASLLWFSLERRRERQERSARPSFTHDNRSGSWIDPFVQGVEDLKSRIGELPNVRARHHWPWDRKRQTKHPTTGQATTIHSSPINPATSTSPSEQKSGLCIGSIFGLDVGGSLAKLAFLEKKVEQSQNSSSSTRERHYHQAASAQAVLMARRGNPESEDPFAADSKHHKNRRRTSSGDVHSSESNDDLNLMYLMRQESLPDDLNEFAASVNLPECRFRTQESMELIVLGKQTNSKQRSSSPPNSHAAEASNSPSETSSRVRKSRSMFNLSQSRDHAEALNSFYNFAKRLDTYRDGVRDNKLSFYSRELGGEFHFINFETRRMQNAMDLIRANQLHLNIKEMGATGGGAHKYAAEWERMLGIRMIKKDELDSLVAGMQFVLSTVVGECYTFRPKHERNRNNGGGRFEDDDATSSWTSEDDDPSTSPQVGIPIDKMDSNEYDTEHDDGSESAGDEWWWSRKVKRDTISQSSQYPYLLVTIGTGVSVLRVDGPRKHERISGSTIGGGTYWGLMRLLTDVENFDDVMRLAERGDPSKVDMMVGDIYGQNSDALKKLGLPSDLVASSFAKLVAKDDPSAGLKEEDLARALLFMVTTNIGQVAYLNAKLHKTSRIYFVGNFLRRNKISQRRLSYAIDYWSKGEMEALFLEHEGYFGALGAFLLSQGISHDGKSSENGSDEGTGKPMLHRQSNTPPLHRRSHTMAVIGE